MKGADSKIHVIGHMRIFLPTSENICLRLNQMQVQWSSSSVLIARMTEKSRNTLKWNEN